VSIPESTRVTQPYLLLRFLLARLHIDSLMDKRTKKDVVRTLNQLRKGSTTLDSAYEGAIQRVEGQMSGDCALAKRVLSWITYVQRPLTPAEIRCALAVELDKGELDLDNVPYIEDIVLVCAGLVIVDERSNIIRLVHYTTQEYFERNRKAWNPSAELDITSTCLTYLCFNTFKGGACPTDHDFESRLEQNAFLDYAARYWGLHAVTVQYEVYELACRLFLHNNSISSAIQALSVSDFKHQGYSQNYPKRTTGLHVTALFGLPIVSKKFISRLGKEAAVYVNAMDSIGQAPLLLAARAGHEGMVKLLINTGADINALAVHYGNALRGASEGGYEKIVMILLNAGADIEALGGEYGSALYAASDSGHEQTVTLLLTAGADVNAWGGYHGSPLRAASEGGHEQVVKLLLDAGADINAEDEYQGSALQRASEGGYEQVVKMLLDAGADIEAQGGEYSSALQAASYRGHEQMVKLLLDAGANVNDLGGEDVLYLASWRGHEQVVKLLLDAGADVEAHGGKYGSALQAASHESHEEVVKLLLDAGADNNTLDQSHSSALQEASEGATSK
jgi:ankyrin repeat protein